MAKTEREAIIIRVPKELKEALRKTAKARGLTMSAMMNQMLWKLVKVERTS